MEVVSQPALICVVHMNMNIRVYLKNWRGCVQNAAVLIWNHFMVVVVVLVLVHVRWIKPADFAGSILNIFLSGTMFPEWRDIRKKCGTW